MKWLSTLWSASKLGTSLITGWPSLLTRVALVGALLAVGAVWVYAKGQESGLERLYAFQAQVAAETAKELAKRDVALRQQREISDATIRGLQGDLSDIRSQYDSARADIARVQHSADSRGRALSELARSSLGACPAQSAELSDKLAAVESEVLDLLERADNEHAKYVRLWQWAQAQSKVAH